VHFNEPVYQNGSHLLIYICLLNGHEAVLCGEELLLLEHYLTTVLCILSNHLRLQYIVSIDLADLLINVFSGLFTPESCQSLALLASDSRIHSYSHLLFHFLIPVIERLDCNLALFIDTHLL
jgi:hypothetical protein